MTPRTVSSPTIEGYEQAVSFKDAGCLTWEHLVLIPIR